MPFHDKMTLADLARHLTSPPYTYICSSSFEDRCLSVAEQVDPAAVSSALICMNEDMRDVVSRNDARLRERFGGKAVPVSLRTDRPLHSADGIQKALSELASGETRKYLVDITTFTHEGLLILLNLLRQHANPGDSALFAYNPAGDYAVGMDEEDKWLSKGIGEIRSVLGYPGRLRPSRKCHLIVLVGYEVERAGMLIEAYEPAVVSLGLGAREESVSRNLYELNTMFHQRLKDKLENVHEFPFSCINHAETRKAIEKQARSYEGYNVVLAPMNTKISSIGAAVAAFANEDIQLCYAQAYQYNYEHYSTPSDQCYLFDAQDVLGK